MKPAVFFDRDGVLNVDHGYTYRKEDFDWMSGAIEAIKWFNNQGYWVFVVTNQSGIARGYYTDQDVVVLHAYMQEELQKCGAHIDQFYYCPHHVGGKVPEYTRECQCRKPKAGMLLQAMQEWSVDLNKSLMIGDKQSDIEAAQAAGIQGYLFNHENLYEFIVAHIAPIFLKDDSDYG